MKEDMNDISERLVVGPVLSSGFSRTKPLEILHAGISFCHWRKPSHLEVYGGAWSFIGLNWTTEQRGH